MGNEDSASTSRRRVPEHLRQRTEISCDRCKSRKIRCLRPRGPNQICGPCGQSGARCEFTAPRKQKLDIAHYRHLEERCRALESLVKAMHPGRSLKTMYDLVTLGKEQGVDIMEKSPKSLPPNTPALTHMDDAGLPENTFDQAPTLNPTLNEPPLHPESTILESFTKIPEGRLLPGARGEYHYVGPASVIYFAITARQIVSKADLSSIIPDEEDFLVRLVRAAEFTSYGASVALEARVPGHPATEATDGLSPANSTTTRLSNIIHSPSQQQEDTFVDSNSRSGPTVTAREQHHRGDWRQVLPPREVADRLVRAFFARVHPRFTIFHRGSFFTQYEAIWIGKSSTAGIISSSKDDPGWVCAFFMVLVLGAVSLEAENDGMALDPRMVQHRYLTHVVWEGLASLCLTPSMAGVQALMLLSLYQHNAGERNGSWMLIGQAARSAIALGMHREGDSANFNPVDRNIRRIVWWTLTMFEQILSFILGRPSSTDFVDVSAPLPDEDFIDGNETPPGYFAAAVSLTSLAGKVKRFIASISASWNTTEVLVNGVPTAKQLSRDLDSWRMSLPMHLQPTGYFINDRHRRAVLHLHVVHEHLLSVLGRPFLLNVVDKVVEQKRHHELASSDSVHSLASSAVDAARQTVHKLTQMAQYNQLDGLVWLDLFYFHHAIFILCLPRLTRLPEYVETFAQDQTAITQLVNDVGRLAVAPTYRILLGITKQFAMIVGLLPSTDGDNTQSTDGWRESQVDQLELQQFLNGMLWPPTQNPQDGVNQMRWPDWSNMEWGELFMNDLSNHTSQ